MEANSLLPHLNFRKLSTFPNIQPTDLPEESILDLIFTPSRQAILDLLPIPAVCVDEGDQQQVLLHTPFVPVHIRFQMVFEVVSNLLVGSAQIAKDLPLNSGSKRFHWSYPCSSTRPISRSSSSCVQMVLVWQDSLLKRLQHILAFLPQICCAIYSKRACSFLQSRSRSRSSSLDHGFLVCSQPSCSRSWRVRMISWVGSGCAEQQVVLSTMGCLEWGEGVTGGGRQQSAGRKQKQSWGGRVPSGPNMRMPFLIILRIYYKSNVLISIYARICQAKGQKVWQYYQRCRLQYFPNLFQGNEAILLRGFRVFDAKFIFSMGYTPSQVKSQQQQPSIFGLCYVSPPLSATHQSSLIQKQDFIYLSHFSHPTHPNKGDAILRIQTGDLLKRGDPQNI